MPMQAFVNIRSLHGYFATVKYFPECSRDMARLVFKIFSFLFPFNHINIYYFLFLLRIPLILFYEFPFALILFFFIFSNVKISVVKNMKLISKIMAIVDKYSFSKYCSSFFPISFIFFLSLIWITLILC